MCTKGRRLTTKRLPCFVCKSNKPLLLFVCFFATVFENSLPKQTSPSESCGNANVSTNIMAGTTRWKQSLLKTVCKSVSQCVQKADVLQQNVCLFVCKVTSSFCFLSVFFATVFENSLPKQTSPSESCGNANVSTKQTQQV